MSLLALIPARGGSKGIPRKNLKLLSGKPLIAWSIEAAQNATSVNCVVVSSEDSEILEVSRTFGATVPFVRPPDLASDDTPSLSVVLHAIDLLPEFEWVLLLQPTSPLRKPSDIDGIVQFCKDHNAPSAVSISPVAKHPYWMYRLDENQRIKPLMPDCDFVERRQDLPPVYALNGSLYLVRCDWLRENKRFVGPETIGFPMPAERSVDIDTDIDWQIVEVLFKRLYDE